MVTARVEYNVNPRFVPDDVPIWLGNSKDCTVIYDATAKEWTVQTTNGAGALQDRMVVKAEQDTTVVVVGTGAAGTRINVDGSGAYYGYWLMEGAADRYLLGYHSTSDFFVLRSFDIDGAGTDGDVFRVPDGAAEVQFQGDIQFTEMTAPAAGAVNTGRLFARDNGSGKTQLAVIFNTGAIQVLATEP